MGQSYRGKNVVVELGAVDISGDGRSVSFAESAETLDDTKYGQDSRTKIASLTDANGSMNSLDSTGAWTAAWDAIKPGSTDTLTIYPEGNVSGNRKLSATVVVTSREVEFPYDNLATLSMAFEVSGDVVEDVVTP